MTSRKDGYFKQYHSSQKLMGKGIYRNKNMKKKDRKELSELAKNPQGGIIMALKERGKKFEFKKGGSVTNEDINDLLKQINP